MHYEYIVLRFPLWHINIIWYNGSDFYLFLWTTGLLRCVPVEIVPVVIAEHIKTRKYI